MNIKKLIATAAAGAMLFGFGGSAFAMSIPENVNIYGASAQFIFWAAQAKPFLLSECPTANVGTYSYDSKHSITIGDLTSCGGPAKVVFNVASKASFDGVCAEEGNYGGANPNCSNPCAPATNQRQFVDPATCTLGAGTLSCTPSPAALACATVNGAASDVQASSFVQHSYGQLKGPLGGGLTTRDFSGSSAMSATAPTLLTDNSPVIVPFSFYVNKSVTSAGVTITNLTSAQIKLIFSGQIIDWSDMINFDAKPIEVCMRHAGSGTHATIDLTQMRPASLLISENVSNWGVNPTYPLTTIPGGGVYGKGYGYFFNDGSPDEMNCVNGVTGSWPGTGAVGYSDSDQSLATYANTVIVSINGVAGDAAHVKANIVNGLYDFWTIENLYTLPANNPATDNWFRDLLNWAGTPGNIAGTSPAYAGNCEMIYWKSSDSAYPIYRGAQTCPTFAR